MCIEPSLRYLPAMRWTIEFGGEPQDVTVATTGTATPAGFAGMNTELVEDERFRPGMLVLLDPTGLDVGELDPDDVRTIAVDFVGQEPDLHTAVVALVAPEPLQYWLARMSTILADFVRIDHPPRTGSGEIRVFSTRPTAVAWLGQVRDTRSGTSP